MITFAFLGNTLFLTILVSMLSNTFAGIVSNASAEIQYRRSVLTLEGVKSDAIFAYQPPTNILALIFLLPLKFMLSPRWFHKINVAAVRTLNAPLLLLIAYVERRTLWSGMKRPGDGMAKLTRTNSARGGVWGISRGFSVHGDIQAVFDTGEPENTGDDDVLEEEEEEQVSNSDAPSPLESQGETPLPAQSPGAMPRARKDSMEPFGALKDQLRDMIYDTAGGGHDEGTTNTRLDRMEASIRRIEGLLIKLVKDLEIEAGEGPVPLEDGDPLLKAESHE